MRECACACSSHERNDVYWQQGTERRSVVERDRLLEGYGCDVDVGLGEPQTTTRAIAVTRIIVVSMRWRKLIATGSRQW